MSFQKSCKEVVVQNTGVPYSGPIFDVQAHAILPGSYEAVASGIRKSPGLANGTAAIM
jgi:hypothetical protein